MADRCSVIFADYARAGLLNNSVPRPSICVKDGYELASELARGSVRAVFIDASDVRQLERTRRDAPVIAVIDGPSTETRATAIRLLTAYPWLSHVMHASLLARPKAPVHLALLLDKLEGGEQALLGPTGVGRVACIGRASRREARFERIREFFGKHGLSPRAISALLEVCEELVMNALYDAPFEGGYLEKPVSREIDLELPVTRACEISYGVEHEHAFVRVRDTFGALTRPRLLQVLDRCSTNEVVLDESRGGAGLGLLRVFSVASSIAIRVVPGKVTEILVGLEARQGRSQKELVAVDFFFGTEGGRARFDAAAFACLDEPNFDHSITLVA